MRAGLSMRGERGLNLEAAVLDALEAVMSPALAMRVVLTALRYADRAALPRDPEPMSRFVIGPLREAVEEAAGLVAYEAVSDRLAPLLLMASSGVRSRAAVTGFAAARGVGHVSSGVESSGVESSGVVPLDVAPLDVVPLAGARERATLCPPRGADTMLVVSRDPAFVERMRAATTDSIDVSGVERALDLVSRTEQARAAGLAVIVVVDALLPSVDLTSIAALATRDDAAFDVVLVGATAGQLRRIRYQIAASHGWVACEIEHAADVAVRELARVRGEVSA